MKSGCNFSFSFELVLSVDSLNDLLICRERFGVSLRLGGVTDSTGGGGGVGGGVLADFARIARKRVFEFLLGRALDASLAFGLLL